MKKVTLAHMKSNMVVFLPDKFEKNAIFHKGNHRKTCDAVVIIEQSVKDILALYIDLKSGKTKDATIQFKSTTCFMEYICSILKILHKIENVEVTHKYIILHGGDNISLKKKVTRISVERAKPDYNNPPKRLVKNADMININYLM